MLEIETYDDVLKIVKEELHLAGPEQGLYTLDNCEPYVRDFVRALYLNANGEVELARRLLLEFEHQLAHATDVYFHIVGTRKPSLYIAKSTYYLHKANILSIKYPDEALDAYKLYFAYQASLLTDRSKLTNGKRVFSFRPINEYSLADLLNGTITVASPSVMNDPFDTLLFPWIDYKEQKNAIHEGMMLYHKAAMGYKIRSFSTVSYRGAPYKNTLMWSHYADSHRGICIEYRLSTDLQEYRNPKTGEFYKLVKVDYRPGKIDFESDRDFNGMSAMLAKSKEWKYEQEERLITYQNDLSKTFIPIKLDNKSYIAAIYFGLDCNPEQIKAVISIFKGDKRIKFFRMVKDYNNILTLKLSRITKDEISSWSV